MDQMLLQPSRDVAERDRRRRRSGGISQRSTQTRGRGRVREAGAAQAGLGQPGRSGREPHREQGRRLGRRQVRHLRRPDRRQELQLHLPAAQTSATPGSGNREAGQPVHDRRQDVPAHRHPGQGERAATRTSTTSRSRGCSTRGSCVLAAPGRTRRRTTSRPASTRPRSRRSRERRSSRSTTSSPSSRRRSTTRSRRRRSSRSVEERPEAVGLRQLLGLAAHGGRHEHA